MITSSEFCFLAKAIIVQYMNCWDTLVTSAQEIEMKHSRVFQGNSQSLIIKYTKKVHLAVLRKK